MKPIVPVVLACALSILPGCGYSDPASPVAVGFRGALDDDDADAVVNRDDNCPQVPNATQSNADGDLSGDACDSCPDDPDWGEIDGDDDGLGRPCDPDDDADGIADRDQECVIDLAGAPDRDGDGWPDRCDTCPLEANRDFEDRDGDGIGDPCDEDLDNDRIRNEYDPSPTGG